MSNNNTLVLVAVGIGAYLFMSRRTAIAQPLTGLTLQQQQDRAASAQKNNLIAAGLSGVMGLVSKYVGSGGGGAATSGATLGGFAGTTIPAISNWFGSSGLDFSSPTPALGDVMQNDGIALNPAGFQSGYEYLSGLWGG
jgi:hypothetical protein